VEAPSRGGCGAPTPSAGPGPGGGVAGVAGARNQQQTPVRPRLLAPRASTWHTAPFAARRI